MTSGSNDPPSASSRDTEVPSTGLRRVLGPVSATAIVVGSVIGSGIFFKANLVASSIGRVDGIILVWIVCGILSLLGALATAELAAMMPNAGGQYVYLREAFGPGCAFLWGWAEFWMMRAGSVAALSVAFSTALSQSAALWFQQIGVLTTRQSGEDLYYLFPGGLELTQPTFLRVTAIASILLLAVVNCTGTQRGGLLQNITTFLKAGTLLSIIVLPFLTGQADLSLWKSELSTARNVSWMAGIATAMTAVFWAYDGWGNIGPVAEEIRNPRRNIPIALTGGMLIVIVLYVGATLSYHLLMTTTEISQSRFVAASAFEKLFGSSGSAIASAAVMISTFGALNANLLAGPRVIFAMSRDGVFLQSMSRIHPRYHTPHIAILSLAVWSVFLIAGSDLLRGITAPSWLGSFPAFIEEPIRRTVESLSQKAIYDVLTDFVVFGAFVFYLLSVVAVFVLRSRKPEMVRPWRTPGYPILPAVFVLGSGAFLLGMLLTSPVESLAGLGIMLAGGLLRFVGRRRCRGSAEATIGNPGH
ncbi:MAG: APC family permease [Planctomyces sp.]